MNRFCPIHGIVMEPHGKYSYCPDCEADYRLRGLCNECGCELERISACGASNWFCHQCNELKSKTTVVTEWVRCVSAS